MAKWGEGDPRWIVEERPDATNVNNWHWTEKNATAWSKSKLQSLLSELEIDDGKICCKISDVDKCEGEATANNRKGKLIFFYEWKIDLKWSGRFKHNNSEEEYKGKVTIPNLSEENDIEDVEITITIEKSNDESELLKQFMYNVGREKIRSQLNLYIKELKEEYSKNLILPKKNDTSPPQQQQNQHNSTKSGGNTLKTSNKESPSQGKGNGELGCKLDVRTLTMSDKFQCSANDLYNALTKIDMLTAFTRAPVKVEAIRGGEFFLYGGNVQGKFEELIPEKKISQLWRLKSWPSGHYSSVVIELEENKSNTELKLSQTGIPASEYESMKTNWNRYYWNSIKQTFGFGAMLF